MKQLSVFVDESGDFGSYRSHSPYYIITMIFHNQSIDLTEHIQQLNIDLANLGYRNHVVHTEPLIRREEDYKNIPPNERRAIFTKLFRFVNRSNIHFKSFIYHKKEFPYMPLLEERMAKDITFFIRSHLDFFQSFDKIILYYDNGQHQLNRILTTVFSSECTLFEMRKVLPCNYKLFQAADLICTLILLQTKIEHGQLTHSEELLFHSKKELKKDFLKPLNKKSF